MGVNVADGVTDRVTVGVRVRVATSVGVEVGPSVAVAEASQVLLDVGVAVCSVASGV